MKYLGSSCSTGRICRFFNIAVIINVTTKQICCSCLWRFVYLIIIVGVPKWKVLKSVRRGKPVNSENVEEICDVSSLKYHHVRVYHGGRSKFSDLKFSLMLHSIVWLLKVDLIQHKQSFMKRCSITLLAINGLTWKSRLHFGEVGKRWTRVRF